MYSTRINRRRQPAAYFDSFAHLPMRILALEPGQRATPGHRGLAVITLESGDSEQLLIARPNCSASWRENRLLIVALGCWSLLVALFFIALGLWPVAPFLGVEVLAVACGLYTTCRKLEQRHVLHIQPDTLVLEKGRHCPRFSWRLPRASAFVSVEVQPHAWGPLKIFLCNRSEHIAIGNFLSSDESRQLLQQLRAQGLAVRNYSPTTRSTL